MGHHAHRHNGASGFSTEVLALLRGEGPLPEPGDERWRGIAGRLVAEGLAGVALSELARRRRLEGLDQQARFALERDLNRVRTDHVILFDRFGKLSDLMASEGVEFLVHKGGALAPLIYDRVEDRPMVDIDIVIRARTWRTVRDALARSGYRLPQGAREAFWLENYFNLAVASPDDPPASFDLHWGLTQEGRYHVDTEELFERGVEYTWDGRRLVRLGNEDLLLSLFLHLAYHYFEARLLWLYDMKRVIERLPIDWEILVRRARGWGLSTVLAFNVSYLQKVFPGCVPEDAIEQVRPGGVRRALVRPLLSGSPVELFRGRDLRVSHFILGLIAIDRPADAVRFAGDKIVRTVKWLGRRPRRR